MSEVRALSIGEIFFDPRSQATIRFAGWGYEEYAENAGAEVLSPDTVKGDA